VEESLKFGNKLRELRKKAGLTLRELARRINVDFTYISKLENGQLPPPSEQVISRLAEVLDADRQVISRLAEALDADREELIRLSGRVPADIAEILKNQAKREFGLKLKELREKARLTQQEVAEKVGINATYISKIENGVMAPPTKGIIILLAEVLRTNKDELIALAGKTPVNIAKMRKKLDAGL
jgi:transcriptional regulator with XRE-family HTH domain